MTVRQQKLNTPERTSRALLPGVRGRLAFYASPAIADPRYPAGTQDVLAGITGIVAGGLVGHPERFTMPGLRLAA